MNDESIKVLKEIKELLQKNLEENKKQTEWVLAWKKQDEEYHEKTLKKLDKGVNE